MFQKSQTAPDGSGKSSPFYRCLTGMSTAAALGATILFTPRVYDATRGPLHGFLSEAYGAEFGDALTLTFGVVEAALVFFSVRLLFISLLIWAFTALGRRFT